MGKTKTYLILAMFIAIFSGCEKKDSDSKDSETTAETNESVGQLSLECGGQTCIGTEGE